MELGDDDDAVVGTDAKKYMKLAPLVPLDLAIRKAGGWKVFFLLCLIGHSDFVRCATDLL